MTCSGCENRERDVSKCSAYATYKVIMRETESYSPYIRWNQVRMAATLRNSGEKLLGSWRDLDRGSWTGRGGVERGSSGSIYSGRGSRYWEIKGAQCGH